MGNKVVLEARKKFSGQNQYLGALVGAMMVHIGTDNCRRKMPFRNIHCLPYCSMKGVGRR